MRNTHVTVSADQTVADKIRLLLHFQTVADKIRLLLHYQTVADMIPDHLATHYLEFSVE